MRVNGRARLGALCTSLLLVGLGAPVAAEASPASEVRSAFSRLVSDTKRLPGSTGTEKALLKLAARARRASKRRPCRAKAIMSRYKRRLRRLKRLPPPGGARAAAVSTRGTLEAAAVAVDAALLSHPRARRCGGARRAPTSQVKTSLLRSSTSGLTMRVRLPTAHFASRRLGGRDWSELVMDGLGPRAADGKPAIPVLTEQFGVPNGADFSVRVSKVSSYTLRGVNLLPVQPEAVDHPPTEQPPEETFFDDIFRIDSAAYRARRPFPARPGGKGIGGVMRDVNVGGADIAGGQYRPRSKRLRVITGMDVRVTFRGGDGTFGDARLTDPFNATFDRVYASSLRNYDVLSKNPGQATGPFCGVEVLIVTTSTLRPAANTLRTQKQAEGFVTGIVEAGSGPGQIGTSNTDIQTYIRNQLNSDCHIRPSYVILIGDTSHVPTFIVPCTPDVDVAECDVASDLPYAKKDEADHLADTALGRIPAPDLATANTVVSKIVGYETTAPAPPGDDFFSHSTVTSYFEPTYICELNEGQTGTPNCKPQNGPITGHYVFHPEITQDARGFTKTSERVRNTMLADGQAVDRVYNAHPETDPQTYYDGTPMPAEIKKPGFPWDGDGADLIEAFNQGRNIVLHRDHGGPHGWAHPSVNNGDLPLFTNGTQLPVAFGINCSSGAFDVPGDPSFMEGLLQDPDGGAVGGFGDTRVSNTWTNNHITHGFFDALFPDLVDDYGADDPLQRMGDVLLAGKQYLVGTVNANHVYKHGHLYHYFGDPTMQLWINRPEPFDPSRIHAVLRRDLFPGPRPPGPGPDPPPFWVQVNVEQPELEGMLVTLEKRGVAIGRGKVQNGQAMIVPRVDTDPRELSVALQDEGFFAGQDTVEGQ